MFTVEGTRAVEELLGSPLKVIGVLHVESYGRTGRERALLELLGSRHIQLQEISGRELGEIADTDHSQGIVALAEVPEVTPESLPSRGHQRWVVLDALQDPGNVGTIIRTAAALGADGVLLLPGTVDPWNAKVVRSAMGSSFHLPVMSMNVEEFHRFATERSLAVWVADAGGSPVGEHAPPSRLALVVGNEGSGVSPAMASVAERKVALPIAREVESLNVAVATGILLYVLRQ